MAVKPYAEDVARQFSRPAACVPSEISRPESSAADRALRGFEKALDRLDATMTNPFNIKPEQADALRAVASRHRLHAEELESLCSKLSRYEARARPERSDGWAADWRGHYLSAVAEASADLLREGGCVLDLTDYGFLNLSWKLLNQTTLELVGSGRIDIPYGTAGAGRTGLESIVFGRESPACIVIRSSSIYRADGTPIWPRTP